MTMSLVDHLTTETLLQQQTAVFGMRQILAKIKQSKLETVLLCIEYDSISAARMGDQRR